ncbi:MAG TPA: putative O-glycosylation ligase, exosortase A system-associated [Telluria sp.]|nr:putative O-glycosylation ligase, exosortase A system-associated [Telluria sp.]
MRDVIITLIVLASLPYTLKRPYIGVLMWVWISVMNPHRLSWGFAYNFPFAAIIAATTLIAVFLEKGEKKLPMTPVVITLLCFTGWMAVTTVFAFFPAPSYEMLTRVAKIMLMTCVTMMVVRDKRQLHLLIWTLVGSLGYYGIKGGLFTIISGGNFRVWGPEGTYIEGNNEVALALIAIIPIIYYLFLVQANKWVRYGCAAAAILCCVSALGSYSRGALLGISAMVLFLWVKSPKKMALGLAMLVIIPTAIAFMPAKWSERMNTVKEYKEDDSAMGRINAWAMAFHLASDRPLTGGGFAIYDAKTFARYAPVPEDVHAAHSLYFQALGEHGFVGLGLYLLLGLLSWRTGSRVIKHAAKRPHLKWAGVLATMLHVSMIGFGVGGAFLSLLYFDVPYYLMAIMVITGVIVEREVAAEAAAAKHPRRDADRAPMLATSSSK